MQESWKDVKEEDLPTYISDNIKDELIRCQPYLENQGVCVTFHKKESVRTCVYRYSCVYNGYPLDFFLDVKAMLLPYTICQVHLIVTPHKDSPSFHCTHIHELYTK